MSGAGSRTARYWVRATVPRRWRGLVGLAVLVGLLGAVSMGALAAARRTEAAYPAYLRASHASPLQLFVYDTRTTLNTGVAAADLTEVLARLPRVTHVAVSPTLFLLPSAPRGRRVFHRGEVNMIGSARGAYVTTDRPVVVRGAWPSPADPHAVVASVSAARLLGWHVGERVGLDVFTLEQALRAGGSLPSQRSAIAHTTVVVSGFVVFANEVAHDDVDRYPVDVLATPALTRAFPRAESTTSYLLQLRGGDAAVPAVEREVVRALPPFSVYEFHVTSVVTGQVQRAIRPEAIAFAVFGSIAALAALLIGAQAVRRQVVGQRDALLVARSLGASRGTLLVAGSAGSVLAVVVGGLVAIALAVVASPLAPVGPVRDVDPSPGVAVDVPVLIGGAALLATLLGALAVATAAAAARPPRSGQQPTRSRAAEAAARAGLPAWAVTGLRFSFQRGSQRSATSVYSVLVASALAVAVAATTVTFGSSLTTLTGTPALYGWGWDAGVLSPSGQSVPPLADRLLARDPQVAAWTGFSYALVQLGGRTVPLLLVDRTGGLGPPVLAGRGLGGPHEIVLGAATAASLHLRVGDHVVASYGTRQDFPIWVPPTSVRVVGIATMPTLGNSGNLHPSMGVGAELSTAIEPPAMQAALHYPDPNQNGPEIVVVRFRQGVTTAAGIAGLERIARAAERADAADRNVGPVIFTVIGAQRPAEIIIYQTTGATPAVLAAALAAGTVVALAMALASSVRRRRRDLALLKTLGFTRRQLVGAIASQATVVALVGALFGVPIGIALGRWLWIKFAETIGAVPEPTVPLAAIAGIVLAAIALANVVAALPGRVAARTPAALVLRTE